MRVRLSVFAVLAVVFALGLWSGTALQSARAAGAAAPQVAHIAPTDSYPTLAPGISGKILGHAPSGDIEVVDITRAPQHVHANIDEVVYVISGHGRATIGTHKYTIGPGDVAVLPRGVPHSLFAIGKTPVRLLGIAYPKDIPTDMKPVK